VNTGGGTKKTNNNNTKYTLNKTKAWPQFVEEKQMQSTARAARTKSTPMVDI
jgi:hypothetical protein